MRQSRSYTIIKWAVILTVVLAWLVPPLIAVRVVAQANPDFSLLAVIAAIAWYAAGWFVGGRIIDEASKLVAKLMRSA